MQFGSWRWIQYIKQECIEVKIEYHFTLSLSFSGWVEDVTKGKSTEMGKIVYFHHWVHFIS